MATAHCTASTTLANSANTLSPADPTKRPLCCWMRVSVTSRQACKVCSVASSSSPMRRLKPCTSAPRMAASLRSIFTEVMRARPVSVLRQAQHERLPITLYSYPVTLSVSKGDREFLGSLLRAIILPTPYDCQQTRPLPEIPSPCPLRLYSGQASPVRGEGTHIQGVRVNSSS